MGTKKNKKVRTGFLSRLMLLLNIVVVAGLILSYAASFISPEDFWPLVFFGLAYPALLLLNILFIFYWLIKLKGWLFLSLIAVLIGWNQARTYFRFSGQHEIPEDKRKITVMSFNVRFFDRYSWVHPETIKTRDNIFQLIDRENSDIICFQEFYSDKSEKFNTVSFLAEEYGFPHYHTSYALVQRNGRSFGIATFSKHPVVKKDIYRFKNNTYNFASITDIVVKADTLRVFNIHFESIRLSAEDRLFINDLAQQVGSQSDAVEKYKRIFQKIRFAAQQRASQAREIRVLIENSPHPVILCTDLNDIPSSYAYRQLTRTLKDSFAESGAGLGNTYIGFLPAFRIDYILYDPIFESRSYQTIHERLSDHYPIVTNLIY